jgi:hypothetical protein
MLWMPLFLLFWLSFDGKKEGNGAGLFWAFPLGTLTAFVHYLVGSFIAPGGFGVSRWLYALVDIIFLPSTLPFLAALVLTLCRPAKAGFDLRVFALVWLIPEGVFRSILWGGQANPLYLILAPLLWTAVALGLPLFIDLARERPRSIRAVLCVLGITALPLTAAASFWAFFGQRPVLGAATLIVVLAPPVLSAVLVRARDREGDFRGRCGGPGPPLWG